MPNNSDGVRVGTVEGCITVSGPVVGGVPDSPISSGEVGGGVRTGRVLGKPNH